MLRKTKNCVYTVLLSVVLDIFKADNEVQQTSTTCLNTRVTCNSWTTHFPVFVLGVVKWFQGVCDTQKPTGILLYFVVYLLRNSFLLAITRRQVLGIRGN